MIKRYYYARAKMRSGEEGFALIWVRSVFPDPSKAMHQLINQYNKEYGKDNWTIIEFKRIK